MKRVVLGILVLSMGLFADFKHFSFKDIQTLQNAVIVDIRTTGEWKETGVIPNSKKIMFFNDNGKYDARAWLNELSKYVKDKNQPIVLVCRSGSRTNMVGTFLSKQMGYTNVYDLKGGIVWGYLNMGYKTTKTDLKPNPITGGY